MTDIKRSGVCEGWRRDDGVIHMKCGDEAHDLFVLGCRDLGDRAERLTRGRIGRGPLWAISDPRAGVGSWAGGRGTRQVETELSEV